MKVIGLNDFAVFSYSFAFWIPGGLLNIVGMLILVSDIKKNDYYLRAEV